MVSNNALNQASEALVVGPIGVVAADPTSVLLQVRKDQNAFTQAQIKNNTSGTGAAAALRLDSNSGDTVLLTSVDASYSTSIAGYAYMHCISVGGGHGFILHVDKRLIKIWGTNDADELANCTNGAWTYAQQPSFFAYNTTNRTNQTGNGAVATVTLDAELYDRASNFNTGTYTFTAPVTGLYRFDMGVYIGALAAAMTVIQLDLVTTARTYRNEQPNVDTKNRSCAYTVLANMTAGDTAKVQLTILNGAGDTATIVGLASTGGVYMTYFSGNLVA